MAATRNDYTLDDTDHLILELLQRNGRLTMRELGERIAMSAPGATERVRRLEEAGIITGYHAAIDPDKVGKQIHGYILVENIPYPRLEEFYRFVQQTPELYAAETIVSGGREAVLKIACSSTARLMEINREFYRFCQATSAHLTSMPPCKEEPVPTK